jgi:two-component system LytT family response regulator
MNAALKTSLSCLIADDDEIDRLTVTAHLRKYPFIAIDGVYERAENALEHLEQQPVDVLFLDIDMPGLSGLELRARFMEIPVCIFITAYPDYAVEAFEAAAFDFLIKPIVGERFDRSIQRVREYFDTRQKADLFEHSLGNDTIFIKEGHEKTKVRLHDILYLEALRDYTTIVTPQKKYHVLTTLGNLLNENEFQRHYVRKLDTRNVYLDNVSLPLGKAYKTQIETIFQ